MDKITEKNVRDEMQFWYSKYCNSIMRDERQLYMNLYKAYVELHDYYRLHDQYISE